MTTLQGMPVLCLFYENSMKKNSDRRHTSSTRYN